MVSIIIPIYNAEQYLQCCVESVRNQTLKELEIVLVDDGSTDNCLNMCETFRKKDARIKVVHQKNGGLVSARQAGMRAASGDLIGWVDADDWVDRDYFEQMVQAQMETDADIVAANLCFEIQNGIQKVVNRFPTGVYTREELLPKLIYSGVFFEYGLQPHLCTKLIRREILEKTQMSVDQRICAGEDAAVVYPSVLGAQKVSITDICGYHYIQRPGSMTKTEYKDDLERLQLLLEHLEGAFFQENVQEIMLPQLTQYRKYLMLLKQISVLDQQILLPYGGIPYGSRIVLYGAGVSGQQIYRYLARKDCIKVVLWVDQNYKYYQENGMSVDQPQSIEKLRGQYDYVVVANTSKTTADTIRDCLIELHVAEQKIRWLSEEFICC